MKKIETGTSSMQIEVWRMKDKVYLDTKGMDGAQYFRYIAEKTKRSAGVSKNRIRSRIVK